MEICIFGAGSLGSLVGGVLAREHEVTLVGRDPHISAIAAGGLTITGEIETVVSPSARTTVPKSADLVVVCVKSFDTHDAADALAGCSLDGVLSLQNGMGNESVLADELSCPVLAGTCTYGARLSEPGAVECTGIGDITIGPHDGGQSSFTDRVSVAFDDAGLDVAVSSAMARKLWEKLAVNAGINATTALARIPNGALLDGPTTEIASQAARETARVARTQGVNLDEGETVERTLAVAEATAKNTSSMQQDILAETRTEIDAINGYVVEQADEPVPVNETLTALVRGWEAERGLRKTSA